MIRVLRVLEYEYETAQYMTDDMQRWTVNSPPSNTMKMTSNVVSIRVTSDENEEWIELLKNG